MTLILVSRDADVIAHMCSRAACTANRKIQEALDRTQFAATPEATLDTSENLDLAIGET